MDHARLARLASTLPDRGVAVDWVRSELLARDVLARAQLIEACQAAAFSGEPTAVDFWLTVVIALTHEPREGLERLAVELADDSMLARLLRSFAPPEGGPAYSPRPGERPLTLGERKSLARGRDRGLLVRALRDPHPEVVGILLGNPRLHEGDVVRMAASRPVAPAALVRIVASPRWAGHQHVRNALVSNPFCPTGLAAALALTLDTPQRRALLAAPETPPIVRISCERSLSTRQ